MRENNIHGAEAGKAFADMLAQNTILKELDLSSQKFGYWGRALDAAFAKEFAVGISDNGALTSHNLASNNFGGYYDPDVNEVVATPEGTVCGQSYLSCAYIHSICRPCCYC
jgi:hypothetical protein